MKLFTVLDTKANFYRPPFTARSRGEALRSFEEAANDDKTLPGLHPEDFVLYEIGHFDDTKGELTPLSPTSLGKAIDYVRKTAKQEGINQCQDQ